MNKVEQALRAIAAALQNRGVSFAVVGGLAISVRAEPRFTRDVDLAVSVAGDPEAERLVHDLGVAGYSVIATVEQDATGRLSTARLASPGQAKTGVVVDLLFASSGVEPEVVRDAEILEIVPSLSLPIATVGHLIALKLLAQTPKRPQDTVDLAALSAVATPSDLENAREALRLITDRGFHRGRDLAEALGRFIDER